MKWPEVNFILSILHNIIINNIVYQMGNQCCHQPTSPQYKKMTQVNIHPDQDLIRKYSSIRSEAVNLPITNNHVEQKIKKLTKFGPSTNKIWKMKSPYLITYMNKQNEHQNDLPKGYVKAYKVKQNGQFAGYYEGKIQEGFQPNLKQGGFFVFHNASHFVGTGQNTGIYTNEVTNLKYEGGWVNGQPHGKGKENNNKGVYQGEYFEGEKQGQGKFVWNNGAIYQGNFSKGSFHGKGIFEDPANKYSYKGEYNFDLKHGFGIEEKLKEKYEGEFYCGKRCGKGKLIVYENDDKKVVKYTYEGIFQNNKPDGQGTYTQTAKNNVIYGVWANGNLISICT